MKERLQGLLLGLVIGGAVVGGTAFATTGQNVIEVLYSDIKIYIDGQKVNPKDANGNTVEPFIYNGTTYLPVRAVGEAMGKDVNWDEGTSSVYLISKRENITENITQTDGLENVLANFEKDFENAAANIDNKYDIDFEQCSTMADSISVTEVAADKWRCQAVYAMQELAKYDVNINPATVESVVNSEIETIYQNRLSVQNPMDIDSETTMGTLNRTIVYYQSAREYAKTVLSDLYKYTHSVKID